MAQSREADGLRHIPERSLCASVPRLYEGQRARQYMFGNDPCISWANFTYKDIYTLNQDIHAWGLGNMVYTIVSDIEKRPEEYKPAIVDGFYINRDGNDLLLMKREGALSTDTSRKKNIRITVSI